MGRHRIIYLIGFFIGFFCVIQARSQSDSVAILLQVHPAKDRIQLRWIVNDAYTWNNNRTSAYTIERYTIRRNGVSLPQPEKKILTPVPLAAAPEEKWETLAQQNNYAAILAQALFGEDFDISGFNSNMISEIADRAEMMKQRYNFALYAADRCFECACFAGMGYEDKDVLPGEYYLYRVYPSGWNVLSDSLIAYGYAFTGIDESYSLPRPIDLVAKFGDRTVQLYWNVSLYQHLFTAYQIEKSDDDHQFLPVGMPYTSIGESDYILFADSLEANNKTYYYRVRGLSIFGEISEPSDTVSGKGVEALQINPAIVRTSILDSGDAQIQWEFDEAGIPLLRSFDLIRSDKESGPYETVVPDIPPDSRSITYSGLKPTNYFRIAANSVNGAHTLSFPVLLMPVDSIPPVVPTGLVARADTAGLVYLSWKANTEPDMHGYKLYRGNRKGEELISLITDVLQGTQYVDTVDLQNLNTHVYYALKALDTHYNQSDFSETIEVEKPLKVKPSAPVFTEFKSESDGITLHWIPSSSEEVTRHTLYRREETETQNKPLAVFQNKDTTTEYKDTKVEGNKVYLYTLTAKSKWNVESDLSPEFRVSAMPADAGQALKDLQASVDMEKKQILLRWKNTAQGKVKAWRIYRSENDTSLSFWKETPPVETQTIDNLSLKVGNRYNYKVVVVMKDGGISNSEQITVKY
jgi:fibronectin type 3 domain-containing protein